MINFSDPITQGLIANGLTLIAQYCGERVNVFSESREQIKTDIMKQPLLQSCRQTQS
jgi:hypothetical protein